MAEAFVSIILEQLASIIRQQIEEEVTLVMGIDDKVPKLTDNFQAIQAVLADAESRQFKDNAVRDWLDKLKEVSYDIDDVLDEWNTSIRKLQLKEVENASKPVIRKVRSLIPCYSFCFRKVILPCDIACKIKNINKTLDVIVMEKDRFSFSLTRDIVELKPPVTTSFIDESMVYGRDHDIDTLLMKLLNESSEEPAISIISIIGMGGIGKTTLARLAFNHDKVKTHFDKRIWVCVSEPFDKIRIAKAILESLGDDVSKLVELQTVLQKISQSLKRKKFLLVLDNVCTEEPKNWELLMASLEHGSPESKILVTARKSNVVDIIGNTNVDIIRNIDCIVLGILSEEDSWSLFSKFALFERTSEEYEKLVYIGRKIIGKCKGLPLAIKTLGSLLRLKTKSEEWQMILDSEMWELDKIETALFPPLLLSYYDLPSILKKCFLYCAIFPKDYEIEKNKLIKLWMSQNYLKEEQTKDMELIGEEYFETLAMRSFFQEFKKNDFDSSIESCKMHDIMHTFAQFLTKNECFNIEIDNFDMSRIKIQCIKVQHLVIQLRRRGLFLLPICNEKKLRSLVVKGGYVSSTTLSKLFGKFTCLRRLDLIDCSIGKIPREIKKLTHLRNLDFSGNRNLKELPEILCELYNLQTLNVSNCIELVKLPQDMGKLINLRHLISAHTYNLHYMPKGIERLTCLRTLSDLKLSNSNYDWKAFSIECLENLNNLRYVDICGLGNVLNVFEVKRANLKNKENLFSLGLLFNIFIEEIEWINDNDEMVLEALEPPPNLVKLEVKWYEGKTIWPHWMLSLTNLKELHLDACEKCEYLPPLGRLSSLQSLSIEKTKVDLVGNEFLGIKSNTATSSLIAFPRLKNLTFSEMYAWERWDIIKRDENITIFPSLVYLKISACPKLKKLPDHLLQIPTLKQLEIEYCSILKEYYVEDNGEE